jgi:hypothetical protein
MNKKAFGAIVVVGILGVSSVAFADPRAGSTSTGFEDTRSAPKSPHGVMDSVTSRSVGSAHSMGRAGLKASAPRHITYGSTAAPSRTATPTASHGSRIR